MHIDDHRISEAVELLRRNVGDDGFRVEEMLELVTDSVMTLFGLSGAGLLLVDAEAAVRPVMATDKLGWELERGQEEAREGPCIDAILYGDLIGSRDVRHDERWPGLAAALRDSELGAVLGIPIRLGGSTVGALNVYVDGPHDWDASDENALRAYGRFVESVLGGALLAERQEALVDQLQEALDTRVVIERAIGLLMGRHGVDAVDAFNMLRDQARPQRRKVVDVAAELLRSARPSSMAD